VVVDVAITDMTSAPSNFKAILVNAPIHRGVILEATIDNYSKHISIRKDFSTDSVNKKRPLMLQRIEREQLQLIHE
jgi:hypothetical protein